jgi:4-hydroxythreonine-4-phosphate dehydrogenase
MNNLHPILVVAGEPYSVFLELFFKAKNKNKNTILIVSKKLLQMQMKKLYFDYKINELDIKKIKLNKFQKNTINIVNVDFKFKKTFDKITNKSNNYVEKCFVTALDLIKKYKFSGLINGPISKKHFLQGKNLGITEYLAKKTKKNNDVIMLIYNKKLSVSPITTHLALKDVHKNISKEKIYKHVRLINEFYIKKFYKKPKIAITGLNPHCESNFHNSEEDLIIVPAINKLKKKKFLVNGPFPADTIFMKENFKNYDVIIGMYHDQVLSPMKSLFGFDAINITLGLPFIRISPDHGPNSSMLGKNISNPKSLIEALKFLDK